MEAGRADEVVRLLGSADSMAKLPPLPLLERAVSYDEHTNTLLASAVLMLSERMCRFRRCDVPARVS
jgi:hypothetical protein